MLNIFIYAWNIIKGLGSFYKHREGKAMKMDDALSILVAGTNQKRVLSYAEVIARIGRRSITTTTSKEVVKSIISGTEKLDVVLFIVSDKIEEEQWAEVEKFVLIGHVPVGVIIETKDREQRELQYMLWGNKDVQPVLAEVEALIRLVRGDEH